ncbi:MAG: ATP-binding protein [Sulfuriferula sp.]
MSETTSNMIAAHVRIARHYQRSIRLDVDYGRPDALEGYICHGTAHGVLDSMARQLLESNQRAFTWTGPFGGGKSSLALTLASALGRDVALRSKARTALHLKAFSHFEKAMPVKRGGWLILPVVGKRGSVVQEIARALAKALHPGERTDMRKATPTSVIESLCDASADKRFDGVLLLIDEMGKFLEASATGGDDVYFFQELAESAARSPGRLVVIGILHQAFKQYSARLGLDSRDDWAKVQGRFIDIPLIAASDEVVELIGRAIDTDVKHPSTASIAAEVANTIQRRRPAVGEDFAKSLDRCWPLHPTMAALLGPVSKRQFGQNERSTFGFLASVEPHGFRAYLNEQPLSEHAWYRPDHYWDFLRANLEPAILASPDGHRWAQALEAVERTEARAQALHISLIKNIAVIDLFRNGSGLAAEEAVLCSIHPHHAPESIKQALDDLDKWRIAIFRKHIGAWSAFEGSDFDIDAAVSQARGTLADLDLDLLMHLANLHPVVAKKHYHETGTLRWMSVTLCYLGNVAQHLERYKPTNGEFGQFVLVLPGHGTSLRSAQRQCTSLIDNTKERGHPVVLGLPNNHVRIHELGLELLSLQWVQQRPELEGDSVARREVLARTAAVRASLEEALRAAFTQARWLGIEKESGERLRLSAVASTLANKLYKHSPRLLNELVNRDSLSSNSVKARRDLLYRMLNHEQAEALGIEGFPAERGLYESLLNSTGLHSFDESGNWRFMPPKSGVSRHFAPMWKMTTKLFADHDQRVAVSDIYTRWSEAPYGIRSGVHPILLMAFLLSHKESIAVYKDGMFVPRLSEADLDECLQDPRRFSLRWVTIDNDRAQILNGIANILSSLTGSKVVPDPLEAARGLVAMVLDLPVWAQRTHQLSESARSVRDTLLKASDPHKVLFVDLMTLLGSRSSEGYIKALHDPLSELVTAYDHMLQKVTDQMLEVLDAPADALDQLRERAVTVAGISGDFRLDAFATRLASYEGRRDNIEGILSLAANKPPRDWNDRDIDIALLALAEWALRFRQVEALVSVQGRSPTREAFAVVIGTGGSSKTVSRTFDIAEREKPLVTNLAATIIDRIANQGIRPDVLLAALAAASISIVETNQQE